MPERKLRLPCALLPEGFAEDVAIEIDAAGSITSVAKGVTTGEGSLIDGIARTVSGRGVRPCIASP
jgi:hypothetical protein